MDTSPGLPHPEVCKTEKFIVSADYWSCLVPEPSPCIYVVRIGDVRICSIASRRGTLLKRKIEEKKIEVRYSDDSLGVAPRARLDALIDAGSIAAFKRSNGWVDVAKDPIRSTVSHWQFKGLQRRSGR